MIEIYNKKNSVYNNIEDNSDVILIDAGANKIQVNALIREITGIGIADSKSLVENVPVTLKNGISIYEANQIENRFKSIGAKIEIR